MPFLPARGPISLLATFLCAFAVTAQQYAGPFLRGVPRPFDRR